MRRSLAGFERYYEVSDEGTVYRVARGKGGEVGPLKPFRLRNGYLYVYPSKNDRRRHLAVHRAVAEAFLGPHNGREVNHKNGDKSDNRLVNLEYVTRRENAVHAALNGLLSHGTKQWKAKLNVQAVVQIRELRREGMEYKQIAKWFGVSDSTVGDVVRGESWKHVPEIPV